MLKEDCDWDYSCILQLLEFKLNKMANRFEKQGVAEGSEDRAKEMREAARYCRLLIDDDFFDHEKMDKKWGEPRFVEGKFMVYRNVTTEPENLEYMKDIEAAFKEEERLRQVALDALCGILKNHLFGWWD
jgi:hypothetical protein